MWFKLADRRGLSVDYLKATIPLTRFRQWQAYYEIENETPTTTEQILAQTASVLHNKNCKGEFTALDFLPHVKSEKKEKKVFTKQEGSNFFRSLSAISNKAKK